MPLESLYKGTILIFVSVGPELYRDKKGIAVYGKPNPENLNHIEFIFARAHL